MQRLFEVMDARKRRVDLDGSPNFLHTFGEILTGANEFVDLATDFPASRRYAPLKELVITNNTSEILDLEINGVPFSVVPAGVISTITQAIWNFRLTNNDAGTAAAGLALANIYTPALGADEAARRASR